MVKGGGTAQLLAGLSPEKEDEFILALESLINTYKQKSTQTAIPLSLFADRRLGILEVVVKYLRENHGMTYKQIARLLERNSRAVWSSYQFAVKKHPDEMLPLEGESIPCSVFCDRSMGPLEALTVYLREGLGWNYARISSSLNRDYPTIWLSYNNAIKKVRPDGKA